MQRWLQKRREEDGGGRDLIISKNNFYLITAISKKGFQLVCPKQDPCSMSSNKAPNPKVLSPPCSFFPQLKSHPSEGIDNAQITLFGFVRFARRGECCQAPQDKLCWVLALVPVWRQKKIRSLEKKLVQHMALSHSSQMMAVVLVNLFWGSVSSCCAAAESWMKWKAHRTHRNAITPSFPTCRRRPPSPWNTKCLSSNS